MNEDDIIRNLEDYLEGPCEICKYCTGSIKNHRKAVERNFIFI